MWKLSVVLVCSMLLIVDVLSQEECGCEAKHRNRRDARNHGDKEIIGDMVLEGPARVFFNNDVTKLRVGSTFGPHKWLNNTVNFYIDPEIANVSTVIREAVKEFQATVSNCVVFREIHNLSFPGDYVHIFNGGKGRCYSNVGRKGGKQMLSLGEGCTNNKGTIQHEFMHALGFYHEQSRPDRDDHIWIDFDNTQTKHCGNYKKCVSCKAVTPYNTKSIMHYSSKGFGCGGKLVMFTKKNETIPHIRIFQDTDIQNVKLYYGCKSQ